MKKYMLIVLFLLSGEVFAQEFAGMKVGGTYSSFDNQLQEKGFVLESPLEKDVAVYSGEVAGHDVYVSVVASPTSQMVYRVAVYFEEKTTWYGLESNFDNLLETLKGKYGKPDGVYRQYESPYELNDGYELQALRNEKLHYDAYWIEEDEWAINLTISNTKRVAVVYENTPNVVLAREESRELITNEL